MFIDLRQALRALRSSLGFSALVVLVLALGIGANTAIFSVVHGVLLKPLPVAHPDRLVAVNTTNLNQPDDTSYLDFVEWRTRTKALDRLAVYTQAAATLTGNDGPAVSVTTELVTSDLFPMLGARPALGRIFVPDDDKRGAVRTAIISDALWTSRFGRDPAIVGRTITLDADPFEVIGVMPRGFEFPFDAEDPPRLWTPVYASRFGATWADQQNASFLKGIGELKPHVSAAAAQAELAPLEAEIVSHSDRRGTRSVLVRPFQDVLVKDYRLALLVLLFAVGSVLLIACANVANLLLARGSVRQRELAVRAALGASRTRVARQLILETSVLATVGGAAGIVLALWVVDALVRLSPVQIPRLHAVKVDPTALAFSVLASIATGLASGIVPALQLSRTTADAALRDGERAGSARGGRTRNVLVAAEMALSLVLLAAAGLLLRSFVELRRVDPGFAADHAVAMQLLLPDSRYPNADAMRTFAQKLYAELQTLPGASATALSTTLPMTGSDIGIGYVVEGQTRDPKQRTTAAFFAVSPDYFSTLRIPLRSGRTFTDRDDERSPGVIVVNQALASKLWPGESALGKRITIGYENTGPREVVGVVADVKQEKLDEASAPQIYAPFAQTPWPFVTAIVRTPGAPDSAMASLPAVLARVDPMQAPAEIKTLDSYVGRSVATPRFTTLLVGTFAVLAVLLAGFGLFSVVAYSVAQRQREIGIRVALGASPGDVGALVLGEAFRIGIAGLAIGLAGAAVAARVISALLFGVTAHDPTILAGVSGLLLAVTLVAAYVPARRAMRVDPVVSLRTP